MSMQHQNKTLILGKAKAIACQIVSGELPANEGCRQIADIAGAINVSELAQLEHLAHLQDGSHNHLGWTADSCAPEIIEECKVLIDVDT